MILLVTDRPDSVELPATALPLPRHRVISSVVTSETQPTHARLYQRVIPRTPSATRIVAVVTQGLQRETQGASSGRTRPCAGQDLRVELDWLETFLAVVDRGGFTAASAQVHRSQSRVSAHIAALERDLGVRLVDRTHRPARLDRGGRGLRPARPGDRGRRRLRALRGRRAPRDGRRADHRAHHAVHRRRVLPARSWPRWRQTHPGVRVSLVERGGHRPRAAAARQRPGARRPPARPAPLPPGLRERVLWREPLQVVVPAGTSCDRAGGSRVARRARGPTVDRRRRGRPRRPSSGHPRRCRASSSARGRVVQPRAVVDTPADPDRAGAGGRRRRRRQRGRARPPRPLRPRRPRPRRTRRCAATSPRTGTTRSPPAAASGMELQRAVVDAPLPPGAAPSGGVGSDDLVPAEGRVGQCPPVAAGTLRRPAAELAVLRARARRRARPAVRRSCRSRARPGWARPR